MTRFDRFFGALNKTPRWLLHTSLIVLFFGTFLALQSSIWLGLVIFSAAAILSIALTVMNLMWLNRRADRLYAKLQREYPEADKPDDAQQTWLRHSSFLLLCESYANGNLQVSAGSAFAWDEWTLVTCKHCVDRQGKYTLYSHANGRKFEVERIYPHPKLDLAFIRLKQPHDYPVLLRSDAPLAPDASLWAVDLRLQMNAFALVTYGALGIPFGRLNKSYPVYHGFYHKADRVKLRGAPADLPADLALLSVYPGMSGSPVMHGNHVVGMLFGGNPYMCSFVPVAKIARAAEVLPPFPVNENPLS